MLLITVSDTVSERENHKHPCYVSVTTIRTYITDMSIAEFVIRMNRRIEDLCGQSIGYDMDGDWHIVNALDIGDVSDEQLRQMDSRFMSIGIWLRDMPESGSLFRYGE